MHGRVLNMEVFYPYPPEKVWQTLTNSRALAAWLMENDFEPRLGHKFQFQHSNLPGFNGNIDCQVIELDEPQRLSYTWQDSMMCQPSIVTWTLKAVDGGTRLKLNHKQLVTITSRQEKMSLEKPWESQFIYESTVVNQTLVPLTRTSNFIGRYEALDSPILDSFIDNIWDYKLNERLPQILVDLIE